MHHNWRRLACALLLSCTSGCLFVRHNTRVVREKEALRPIQFESDQARSVFEAGVHELQAHKETSGGDVVAVPLLCWYSHVNELSDNAIYNDQESACDTNGDNIITLEEALPYRAKVTERMAMVDKSKPAKSNTNTPDTASDGSIPLVR
jgi:hypothetical protein